MKIIAWNVGHRTCNKAIPMEAARFVSGVGADMVVLNEYVDSDATASFRRVLEQVGFGSDRQFVSAAAPKGRSRQNQVLIAAKEAIRVGHLPSPQQDDAARSNFLHVTVPGRHLEVVGFRAPFYKTYAERQGYWREMASVLRLAKDRRIMFLGDVNYDPFQGVAASVAELQFELDAAYRIPNPKGEWSFISTDGNAKTRIDHAFVSDGLTVLNADYVTTFDDIRLAGPNGSGAMSDHAALVIELKD